MSRQEKMEQIAGNWYDGLTERGKEKIILAYYLSELETYDDEQLETLTN